MSNQDTTTVFGEPSSNSDNTPNLGEIASQLVGEGKKFKTIDDLAKGKLEADLYVEQLKKKLETSEAERTKLGGNDEKFSQILQELEQRKATPPQGNIQVPVLGQDEIETLVRNQMTAIESERTSQQNLDSTNAKLKQLFGDKAKAYVESKAKELGIDMQRLQSLSAESPSAFFTLVGISDTKPKVPNAPITGSVNTESNFNQNHQTGTKEYYNNLRRTMKPGDYYTKVLPEIMDKVKKGELVL